ncbi:2,3-diaminopropionate biosynthesis protein SbnA [Amycolatopsis cihanbeyliensis]|uniref:Cysteine synthase A n=1 Tax=Amycolatopsis cihanbeyliensis TaxID=1128664 RepID=A0A542DBJ5_AMYCI|nr:2,3-diaminopropionate biosynthesis protein SbnA [Amycolatopsis cihanbeyliensis]TQJ00442.1 cysteine synthase A [Amycolatopsis cihanbeyliensis]
MIFRDASDIVLDDVFVELAGFVPEAEVYLKLEGFNPAGSIKSKTAVALIESAELEGRVGPDTQFIESTSGNLGIALATICAARGYSLTLVTDPNTAPAAVQAMTALGADVVRVDTRDAEHGYLQTRIDYIHNRLAVEPNLVWLNQYANPANIRVHRELTARAIHEEFGDLTALFIGAGTTGTLMGCLQYFGEHSPATQIVAVDAVGSVTFGLPTARRRLPGLGTSRRPEIFVDDGGFEKVVVDEPGTIAMCRRIARRYGLLVGASTGTVLTAVERFAPTLPRGARVVAISPDLGDKYLGTVYSPSWIAEHYPSLSAVARSD